MLWAWGYIVNGHQVFDAFSVFLAGISMMVFMPVILLAGSVYLVIKNDKWRLSQLFFIVDLIYVVGILFFGFKFVINKYVRDIAWEWSWIGSFPYIIFPLLAILIYALSPILWNRGKTDSGSGVDLSDKEDKYDESGSDSIL